MPKRETKRALDETDGVSVEQVVQEVTRTLDGMRKRTAQWTAAVEAQLAKSPSAMACPQGGMHRPNVEESTRESMRLGVVHLLRFPCPKCDPTVQPIDPVSQRLHRSGVPAILLGATFENWVARTGPDKSALAVARAYAERPRGFLILWGDPGLGKTHFACAVLRRQLELTNVCGRLMTQNRLLLDLRATYRNDRAPDPIETCSAAPVLVLDELGVSSGGRDEFPALYEVLNHRHGEGKPTVLTTNLAPADWVEAFGPRISDRMAMHKVIKLSGTSWRGR